MERNSWSALLDPTFVCFRLFSVSNRSRRSHPTICSSVAAAASLPCWNRKWWQLSIYGLVICTSKSSRANYCVNRFKNLLLAAAVSNPERPCAFWLKPLFVSSFPAPRGRKDRRARDVDFSFYSQCNKYETSLRVWAASQHIFSSFRDLSPGSALVHYRCCVSSSTWIANNSLAFHCYNSDLSCNGSQSERPTSCAGSPEPANSRMSPEEWP